MSQIKHKRIADGDETLQAIAHAVVAVQRDTGYGSVEITIHDGRVTQIEKRGKFRITQDKPEKQSHDTQNQSAQKQDQRICDKPQNALSSALQN